MHKRRKLFTRLPLVVIALLSALSAGAGAGTMYITVGAGLSFMQKSSFSSKSIKSGEEFKSTIKNSRFGGEFLLGAGVYAMDSLRVEGVIIKPIFAKSRVSESKNGKKAQSWHITPEVNSLQVRAYLDLFNIFEVGKVYIGAGGGLSQIRAKVSKGSAREGKKQHKLAWMLAAGGFVSVGSNVQLGAEYSYRDFGKMSRKNILNPSLRGHSLLGKVMFSI